VFTNRYAADHGMAGEIVRTSKPLTFNNVAEMDSSGIVFELYGSSIEADPTQSIIAAPMILRGQIYGMVSAQSYQENAYTSDDLYLLEALGSHAAIAIENARLFDSVQHLANTDPLTCVLNRRRFFELAEVEFAKAQEDSAPLSIILLDVDDFKQFNDRHGHKVGDAVLALVAETCKLSLRADDIFCRLGGEEFVVALPNTRIADALDVAERLRSSIRDAKLPESADAPADDPLAVTVSVGVAEYDTSCKSLDALIERADKAMYDAKNSGRNRVRVWGRE
jgi:diguanylate cyclase (GGDEF)-like protein